jgi:hypothetical protein
VRLLAALFMVALTFGLGSAEEAPHTAVLAAYHHLPSTEVEARPVDAPPADVTAWARVDVSAKARSASFGHTTTLLVSPHDDVFYVEYGRSTNRPRRLFGPFRVGR